MTPLRQLRRLSLEAGRTGTPVWRLGARVGASLVRRHGAGSKDVAVPIDRRGTRMIADLTTPFGLSIYRYGFPEPEARLIEAILAPGDVFIDGGANIGIFTLIGAASVTRTGRVVACEPVPETMAILQRNLDLNAFGWVDTRLAALSSAPGTGSLYAFGPGSPLSSFAPEDQEHGAAISVELVTLDALAEPALGRVGLVKLDVEGAEVSALRGATRLLEERADFLIEVEPEHLERQGTSVAEMKAIFDAAGYAWYEIGRAGERVSLRRQDRWRRPPGGPNLFASARPPDAFPPGITVDGR